MTQIAGKRGKKKYKVVQLKPSEEGWSKSVVKEIRKRMNIKT